MSMRRLAGKIKAFMETRGRRDPRRYEREKAVASGGDMQARARLAGNARTHPEILYYLAQHDDNPDVRKALVRNRSTPVQAGPILAHDPDVDVRLALAGRLVTLLPDLDEGRHSQLYAFAVQALGVLAVDEVLKIRKALSSALQDHVCAPPAVVGQLARDLEREVSEPILKFCTALPDRDLLDVLKNHPESWAVQAIAGRKTISRLVSQAVIDTRDRPGGAVLIGNEGADISVETLEQIVERARDYPEWQARLAVRSGLPPKMAKALAKFADRSVRDVLMRREDFDEKTAMEIADIFSRRLDFAGEAGLTPQDRVKAMAKEGRLTEEAIADALGMRDRDFVCAALAQLAGTKAGEVEKIFTMKAPKPIIALAWRAGMGMRFALSLQKEMGHVQPKDLIYPKGGTDYPLTEDDMRWQLEFLGIG